MRNKKIKFGLVMCFLFICITSCQRNEKEEIQNKVKLQVYYLNNAENNILGEAVMIKKGDVRQMILECLQSMEIAPEKTSYKKILPDSVSISEGNIKVLGKGQVYLLFPKEYYELTGIKEILCRAAIVKTLCQIEGVSSVEFYVGQKPFLENEKQMIGMMSGDNFVDHTTNIAGTYKERQETLFFADKTGEKLVELNAKIPYNGSVSIAQLLIEELIKGPSEEMIAKGFFPIFEKNTVLNKISVHQGICYIDFDESFLEKTKNVSGEVVIYSIVNTLVQQPHINKVMFTINGNSVEKYRENIMFDKPFDQNLNCVIY